MSFEVALSSAAKRRRSKAGGENPRFRAKQDHQAPEGRRSNSRAESSVAPSGLSILFPGFSVGLRPRLNAAATSWLTKSATSKLTLRVTWRVAIQEVIWCHFLNCTRTLSAPVRLFITDAPTKPTPAADRAVAP